jgi:hypothetical protein
MAGVLTDFLRAGAAQPFTWGTVDCCTWACDWIVQQRGVDPMAAYRGLYDSARGATRQYIGDGGLETVVRARMAEAGLSETHDPRIGDVGLVKTNAGPALAIRTDIGWASKAPSGLSCAMFPVIAAWRV